jgi:hypothetical protein
MPNRLTGMDIARAVADGGADGLEEVAGRILRRAIAGIGKGDPTKDPAPEIALAERGRVERLGPLTVRVVFSAPYAAKQELNRRLKHPRGGSHSYLRNAMKAELATADNIVASKVQARTKRAAER